MSGQAPSAAGFSNTIEVSGPHRTLYIAGQVARFDDGRAALVARQFGLGRAALGDDGQGLQLELKADARRQLLAWASFPSTGPPWCAHFATCCREVSEERERVSDGERDTHLKEVFWQPGSKLV